MAKHFSGCDYSEISCLHDTKRTRVTLGKMKGGIFVFKRFKVVDENSIARFENEWKLLDALSSSSQHFLRPIGIIREAPVYGILQPYYELGSLGNVLHAAMHFHSSDAAQVQLTLKLSAAARICAARDLMCAVAYCHDEKIIIRDIKPENVFLVREPFFR